MAISFERLDSAWDRVFNPVRKVTVEVRNADDTFGDPQTADALDVAAFVSETHQQSSVGEDGQGYENIYNYSIRAKHITGTITPGSRVTDWNGRVGYVEFAQIKSLDTRWLVKLRGAIT